MHAVTDVQINASQQEFKPESTEGVIPLTDRNPDNTTEHTCTQLNDSLLHACVCRLNHDTHKHNLLLRKSLEVTIKTHIATLS